MTGLVIVAASLLWLGVVVRIPTIVRSATQRMIWAALLALGASVTLEIPQVAQSFDSVPGIGTNVAQLVKHSLVLVAAGVVREVVRHLALPPGIAAQGRGRRAWAMAGALVLLVTLFAAAPVHRTPLPGLTAVATASPALLAYWAVYLLAVGVALVGIARLAWVSVQTFPPSALRAGMGWLTAGAGVGLTYCAHKGLYLMASTATDGSWPEPETMEDVQALLLASTVMIFVVGVQWPAATKWPAVRQLIAYRSYRRLSPLWRAYYEAEPAIALDGGHSLDRCRWPLRDVEMQLYRRVIEIRDGMLAVRPFIDPRHREPALLEAKKIGGDDADVIAEAAWLELARRAKLQGGPSRGQDLKVARGGYDLASEIHVLTQMARARRAVRAIADTIEASQASTVAR